MFLLFLIRQQLATSCQWLVPRLNKHEIIIHEKQWSFHEHEYKRR